MVVKTKGKVEVEESGVYFIITELSATVLDKAGEYFPFSAFIKLVFQPEEKLRLKIDVNLEDDALTEEGLKVLSSKIISSLNRGVFDAISELVEETPEEETLEDMLEEEVATDLSSGDF